MLEIFEQVLKMAYMGTFVILAVFLARALMSRFPKKCVYALWLIVGLRLVCPVAVYSPISLFNLNFAGKFFMSEETRQMPESTENSGKAVDPADTEISEKTGNPAESVIVGEGKMSAEQKEQNYPEKNYGQIEPKEQDSFAEADNLSDAGANQNFLSENRMQESDAGGDGGQTAERVLSVLSAVWLAGMGLLILWNGMLTIFMKKRLRRAVLYKDNIYESDCIPTPFVMGMIRPRIYIPFRLSEQERDYILRHEQYHIRRRDYIVKVLAFLITAVYWFHPLVWAAYFSMIRDMEMSCDEQILWESGEDIRQNYSMSLLAFATNKRQYSMETLAFGETNTKKRVRHIMKCKKKGKWMSVCAVLLFAILGTACLTSGKNGGTDGAGGSRRAAGRYGRGR